MGHRPQNVFSDGDAVRLELNGRLFRVEFLVLFVQGLGPLFPADGLGGLFFYPGRQGAHHAGHSYHGQHRYRVACAAEGEGIVRLHKVDVDEQRPDNRGGDAIGIAGGEQGDQGHSQHEDQGGVVLSARVGYEDAAGVVSGAQKQRRYPQIPGDRRDAVGLYIQPVIQFVDALGHGGTS